LLQGGRSISATSATVHRKKIAPWRTCSQTRGGSRAPPTRQTVQRTCPNADPSPPPRRAEPDALRRSATADTLAASSVAHRSRNGAPWRGETGDDMGRHRQSRHRGGARLGARRVTRRPPLAVITIHRTSIVHAGQRRTEPQVPKSLHACASCACDGIIGGALRGAFEAAVAAARPHRVTAAAGPRPSHRRLHRQAARRPGRPAARGPSPNTLLGRARVLPTKVFALS
jgi:hypothetical protein